MSHEYNIKAYLDKKFTAEYELFEKSNEFKQLILSFDVLYEEMQILKEKHTEIMESKALTAYQNWKNKLGI